MKDEQAEKFHEREREEAKTGDTKSGEKSTLPEDVELDEGPKTNTTEPESQSMKSYDGWNQGYIGLAMPDYYSGVIVPQDVTTDANDIEQLDPMLKECEEVTGQPPSNVLAFAGYGTNENAKLADEQTELFIFTTKDWKRRKDLQESGPARGRNPSQSGQRN
ncbi:transposase IS4 family protein [Halalkaliarchaeum desulfuricum]|uniref:Transposase IS4 family protein n=1 Tax=Halalkaliarchaeum desulfuricum TaxID=2055893 RepID=A0A343TNI9_9EURY|nr:hypothetical protein [Halalkaliarchaeum desulfuricum]AUX10661.1 transposase IS4 family protein [Halalkaliarchaeum desulfuricum]